MSAQYEILPPGGHETYATSIFSKIKTYLDSNPYGYVSKSDIPTVLGTKSYGTTADNRNKKIKIKINPKDLWMLCFTVTLYQVYKQTKVMISGYNYDAYHWYAPNAKILGSSETTAFNVYFGYDANRELWVGFDGDMYTAVTVDSVTNGYKQISDYKDMFTISIVDELTTLQTTQTIYRPWYRNETVANATTASKLGSSNVGSATQPIYLNAGTATACTYTLGKSVPSDAVFTDTKNTAGSTDTSSKIFLIGATSQAANPQTYSQDTAYVGTDGCLYSGGTKVLTAHQDISGKADTDDLARGYSSDTVQLYNTGDLVYYDGDLYRCINGTSGGNWMPSCWQHTRVATELENKIEGISVAGSSGGSYQSEITTSIWFDPNQFNYITGSHKVELNSNFDPSNKVSKTGDTMTGDISWNGETGCTSGLYWKEYGYGDKFKIAPSFSGFNDDNFLGFQAAVGGAGTDPDLAVILKIHPSGKITTTNQVIGKNPASSWIGARDNACFINPNFANNGSYYPVISTKSKSGTWSIGVLSNEEQLRFCWESDSNYSSGKNESTSVILRATAGTIALTSEILPKAGGTMTGNLVCGNTTIYSSGSNGGRNSMIIGDDCKLGDCNVGGMLGLQAASGTNCGIRLYNGSGGLIGGFQSTNGTPQWINSSGTATTISLAGHGHSYLPLSGGTVTGDTTFSKKVQVSGIFKCAVISRYDNNDSGYVNHVNQENNAYRPVRASAFTTMSCKHTKTNIVDISEEDALKLLDIRPVNFDYIEEVGGQKDQIGVLAEDTYEVLPKVVSVPDDYVEEDFDISKGIHQPLPSVDYAKFVPYLIKMVQIQQKEINELKTSLNNFMQHA